MISNKPFIVVQGPVATRSGYGNHTRDLVLGLINSDKYDIFAVTLHQIWIRTRFQRLTLAKSLRRHRMSRAGT